MTYQVDYLRFPNIVPHGDCSSSSSSDVAGRHVVVGLRVFMDETLL